MQTTTLFRRLAAAGTAALVLSSCGGGSASAQKTIARYACAPITVALPSPAGAGETGTVEVTAPATAHATTADCAAKVASTSFPVAEGATTATAYVYTATTDAFTATISAGGTSTSVAVTVKDFDVLGNLRSDVSDGTLLGLASPSAVFSDGTRLFIADTAGNRVLVWATAPTSPDDPPTLVLGQTDFAGITANGGGTASASTMSSPQGVFFDGTKLFVADSLNHRVLIWNTLPTTNGQAADVVVGQASLSAHGSGNGADQLNTPTGVYAGGGKLYVVDSLNHRVLGFASVPTAAGASASFALGQPDTTSNTANNGGIGAGTLDGPRGIAGDGTHLAVADAANSRVLLWNTLPSSNGAPASVVVGQSDFVTSSSAAGTTGLNNPQGAAFLGGNLWIADRGNGRALRYSGVPSSNGAAAVGVLGKPDFSRVTGLRTASATTLGAPTSLALLGTQWWVTDALNHRVLSFASTATDGAAADLCYGQHTCTDADAHEGGSLRTHFDYPEDSHVDVENDRLYVADSNHNRVLVYSPLPTTSLPEPTFVLGQPDLNSTASGSTATSLSYPVGIATAGSKLAVVDTGNCRVLIWNTPPTANAEAPDVVVGQPDMTSSSCATTQATFKNAWGAASDGTRLVVTDDEANRVLVWNTFPTTNGRPADLVLGQPDFTTGTQMNGTLPAGAQMNQPFAVAADGGKLFVADYFSNRVLGWNAMPTTNGQVSDFVVGQPDASTLTAGATAQKIEGPYGVYAAFGRLFVPSLDTARTVGFAPLPSATSPTATLLFGQPDFTSTGPNPSFADNFDELASGSADARRVWLNDSGHNRIRIYSLD